MRANAYQAAMQIIFTQPVLCGPIRLDISLLMTAVALAVVAPSAIRHSRKNMGRGMALLQKISSMIHQSGDLRSVLEFSLRELLDLTGMQSVGFTLFTTSDYLGRTLVFKGVGEASVSALECQLGGEGGG